MLHLLEEGSREPKRLATITMIDSGPLEAEKLSQSETIKAYVGNPLVAWT